MPKVSVIIPIYNVEKYLRECLDSVVNQTLNDIEIICINDGSTDNSGEVLGEYAAKDNRIVVIMQPNQGAGAARNTGIDKAKSEFVVFMDADDFYPENNILEALYSKAKENNVLICGGEFSDFDDNNHPIILNTSFDESLSGYAFLKEGIIEYKDYQFDYGHTRFIYNLNFLKDNRLKYPEYRAFEDPVFFVKVMVAAEKFYAIKKVVYAYRTSHKKVNYDTARTVDMLKGIAANLAVSRKYGLECLHSFTLQRLTDATHYPAIKHHLKGCNLSVTWRLLKILRPEDLKLSKKDMGNLKSKFGIYKIFFEPFIQNIFSIKNIERHKVFSVLGFKIKIRRKNV